MGDGKNHCTEQTTLILAIDPEEEGKVLVRSIRKGLQSATNNWENAEGAVYGTMIPQIEQTLRKILEHEGKVQGMTLTVYLGQKEAKRRKREGPQRWKKKGKNKERNRTETIVVTPAAGTSYSQVVKDMKQKTNPEGCGVKVCNIQATKKGSIKLKVKAKARKSVLDFQKEIKEKTNLASKTEIIRNTGMVVVRDLDETTSKEEVEDAVRKEIGKKVAVTVSLSDNLNPWGYKAATVIVPKNVMQHLLRNKRIVVGWNRCRISEKLTPRVRPHGKQMSKQRQNEKHLFELRS